MLEDAYIAGFLDGEGAVLYVSFGNTNLEILRLIQMKYGGNLYKWSGKVKSRQQMYQLRLKGK